MKLHQLKALVAIADHGSIRAAARAGGMSPAAVTKAVRELEADLETRLITHQSTGATFTEAGRALLVHARLVAEQLQRAEQELGTMAGRAQHLRVGVAAWVAITYLGEAVRRFQQQMPDVRLEFFDGALTVAVPKLRDGTLDLCIGRAPPAPLDAEFSFTPLFRTTSAVVARQGHPLAARRSLAELAGAQWVLNWVPGEGGAVSDDPLARFLATSGATVHVVHSAVAQMSLLRDTDMLGLMAWPLIEALVPQQAFCVLPLVETLNDVATGWVGRRGEPPGPCARLFVACFEEAVRQAPGSHDPARQRVLRSIDAVP